PAEPPSAEPLPGAPRQARVANAEVLNIRAEPSAASADIGDLYRDSVVELTGEERAGWYRIRAGAAEGWVNGKYIEILP
ncbi:MAG TPA: SH3 domain-containing protein, partial [Herpetosiphonaceae bacterium]|nr:SH3 domain-containing protein [Herpetosiphonaceae bacterium]